MAIDAKLIKELREKTGMGISDCKKALEETGGNMEEAEMILRKKGIDKAAKKADRTTGEGLICIEEKDGVAVMLEVMCEQEPTTGNERFLDFVNAAVELAFSTGKTDAEALLEEKSGDETLSDKLKGLIGTLGENIQFKRMVRMEIPAGSVLGQYVHFNKKAGAICVLTTEDGADAANETLKTAANDVCMHSVATRPLALGRDGIPEDVVAKEKAVFMEEVANKPENIQEKILEGKLGKFYQEKCLAEQIFVKDPNGKQTVAEMVADAGKVAGGSATIANWARLELGL